ncbi:uncharacterized protein LOC6602450 [Drosophila persimilis]|nr:uncharacterized protein LOC6602450 [Drosophila persimilis]
MCGGWACASYNLACNNPPLSTVRFTGRDLVPTPCGPFDKCWVRDTSRQNSNNCYVPHNIAPPCPPEQGGPKKEPQISECK